MSHFWRDLAVAMIGPVLVGVLLSVYLVSPGSWVEGVDADGEPTLKLFDAQGELLPGASRGVYLRYILEESYREYQLVEMITFGCSLLAAGVGLVAAGLLWRRARSSRGDGGGLVVRYAAPAVVGVTSLASLFFAGEEVNWGQTFTRWGVSEMVAHGDEPYTAQSVHNNLEGLSVQTMGTAYLILVLVVFPIVWSRLDRDKRPASWAPAVAAWPAAAMVLYAYFVKECKPMYVKLFGEGSPKLDPFYMGYLEQLNEQKEMVLALALLLYACYALARARAVAGGAR